MNIVLWVLQVLLALAFLAHGGLLLFPPAAIVDQMNASLPRWFQLFLGIAEILAAVGLTLVKGTLSIDSRPEHGTTISVLVPLSLGGDVMGVTV